MYLIDTNILIYYFNDDNFTLVTRNVSDFKGIENVQIYNPFC
jgi:predicted nucleic acid-binding protein